MSSSNQRNDGRESDLNATISDERDTMTHRTFVNGTNPSLERDAEGHRTGFKVYIKVRRPMSQEGWNRWGAKQKIHIGKSRYIWKYYSSTHALGFPNGIPVSECKTNKSLGEWLINYAYLSEGETYAIYGWRARSKKHPLPVLTKPLAIIEVQNIEKMVFKFSKFGRLSRYHFRQTDKKHREARP
jgi:hypothetical protein